MLRPSALSMSGPSATNGHLHHVTHESTPKNYDNAKSKPSPYATKLYWFAICATSFLVAIAIYANLMSIEVEGHVPNNGTGGVRSPRVTTSSLAIDRSLENDSIEALINRTEHYKKHCNTIGLSIEKDILVVNNHTAHLPQYGFLDAVRKYKATDPKQIDDAYPYQCVPPPETECEEYQFTVIFMAYNPDRLEKLLHQIKEMLTNVDFSKIVAEVIVVWNGERHIADSQLGKTLLNLEKRLPLRISYPLKAGFPNDLMNRYHPRLNVTTKAIMYYDDDGPFYSYRATLSGFELWKRNSNAQVGAMARKLDLGQRQRDESKAISGVPNDRYFVSQCPRDELTYNYFTFANFDARMVLPSGSFLHSNYLCFLWHPIFEDIRNYVRQHPVNPDDGTVSMLVSQLAGRAPKVYSRRVNFQEEARDRTIRKEKRRRLMDGINWDAAGAHDKKMNWGRLRGDVANSLARYFGSVNSGSLGWCYGTEYHIVKKKENVCSPEMGKVGMLPWMKSDNTAKNVCP